MRPHVSCAPVVLSDRVLFFFGRAGTTRPSPFFSLNVHVLDGGPLVVTPSSFCLNDDARDAAPVAPVSAPMSSTATPRDPTRPPAHPICGAPTCATKISPAMTKRAASVFRVRAVPCVRCWVRVLTSKAPGIEDDEDPPEDERRLPGSSSHPESSTSLIEPTDAQTTDFPSTRILVFGSFVIGLVT